MLDSPSPKTENVNSNASHVMEFDSMLRAMRVSLSDSFGDKLKVEGDESEISISIWNDGLSADGDPAKDENAISQDALDELEESISLLSDRMKQYISENGYSDTAVVVNVLNEWNLERVILSVRSGEKVSDAPSAQGGTEAQKKKPSRRQIAIAACAAISFFSIAVALWGALSGGSGNALPTSAAQADSYSASAPAESAASSSAAFAESQPEDAPSMPESQESDEQDRETPVSNEEIDAVIQALDAIEAAAQTTEPEPIMEPEPDPDAVPEQAVSGEPIVKPNEPPQAITQAPATQNASGKKYVGSKESDKYHYPSCKWVEKILPENKIWFDSEKDARAVGYSPCGTCNPR